MKKIKRYFVEKEGWHIIRSYMQSVEWNVSILDCWCRQTASPAIDIVSIQYIMHDYKYNTEWTNLVPSSFIHTFIDCQGNINTTTRPVSNPTITSQFHPLISSFTSAPTFIPNQPKSIQNHHHHHLLLLPSNPKSKLLCHVRLSQSVALDLLLLLLSTNRILMHHRFGKWTLLLMTRIMMNVHSS